MIRLTVHPLDVLIVEDHSETRNVLDRLLCHRGHRPVQCENAEVALVRLSERFYPIILLDVQLPGMNGLELARHLRSQPDGDKYYILMATGIGSPDDLREILDAGASDYVPKPYHPDFLTVRLTIAEKQVLEIASRRRLEHELKFLATRDPLTNLLNRSQLEPALEAAIQSVKEGREASVLYIDLDNFKVVNDTLGHKAGDRLLVVLASLLKAATRIGDEIVRFGGDEFVVVLSDANLNDALAIAERLREKVEESRFLDSGMTFRVGTSIGVALVNAVQTPSEVLVAADSACYAAKARGRNRVEVHTETDSEIARLISQTDWAARIHEGMHDGSLHLWYQPIVSSVGCEVLYHEVLLRYIDPNQSVIVGPSVFLNSTQRSGESARLDRFVIRKAMSALIEYPDLVFGVNLSAPSLSDSRLIELLANAFSDHSVEPERLHVEITETELMSNLSQAGQTLESISKMGVKIALDDFGTGFSSLAYLKNLPIDYLKIDCAFVRDLPQNEFNQAILRAICEVARIRNIKTVAEHVETAEQCRLIAELGIDYVQGFLVGIPNARPYSQEDIEATLTRTCPARHLWRKGESAPQSSDPNLRELSSIERVALAESAHTG